MYFRTNKIFICMSELVCFKLPFSQNVLLQTSHIKLACMTRCLFKLSLCENFLLHTSQSKDFSFVFVRKCLFTYHFIENILQVYIHIHSSLHYHFVLSCATIKCFSKLLRKQAEIIITIVQKNFVQLKFNIKKNDKKISW